MDLPPSEDILKSILGVLESIDEKLTLQDERFKSLDDFLKAADAERPTSVSTGRNSRSISKPGLSPASSINSMDPDPFLRPTRWDRSPWRDTATRPSSMENGHVDTISHQTIEANGARYKVPAVHGYANELDPELQEMVDKYLGDWWRIPDDNRIPLRLFTSTSLAHDLWGMNFAHHRQQIQNDMHFLRGFDQKLRALPGNDFLIIDYDQRDFARMYRVGERAVGAELGTGPEKSSVAPWSRLILYQGMTTGDSINLQRKDQSDSSTQLIPYFESGDPSSSLWSHISSHLQLKRRDTTTNPYLDSRLGFHTTFYEIQETTNPQTRELWKHGPLYDHPLGWSFRKSAYTLYTPRLTDDSGRESSGHSHSIESWTALLLSPQGFYNKNSLVIPAKASVREKTQILGEWLGKLTPLGSEMALISQGMRRISERWAEFQSFFDFILDDGDSLMQPSEHDNLLFDDGSFSRSRRYFWVIDCLSEFELSITDNILQWEMYRDARIKPFVGSGQLLALDCRQYNNAEEHCHVLKQQRENFRRKLDSTKALRDALFNASAVIESRASTRLGENVKILTFVSIFFLPLAFCTSLWSINDKFSSTAFVIVIVIVALTTYTMVFNVNSLVHTFSYVYDTKKRRLVNTMKSDRDERWKQRGQRFEVFRPKHDDPEPSEWYITLYAMLNLATFLGFGRQDRRRGNRAPEDSSSPSSSSQFSWITNYFRRRRVARKPELAGDSWRQDEPWVL